MKKMILILPAALILSVLTACGNEHPRPNQFGLSACINPADIPQALQVASADPECTTTATTTTPAIPPSCNINSKCVYTEDPTVISCLSARGNLIEQKNVVPVSDPGLIQYEGCCSPNAKMVGVNPPVPGIWLDQNCNAHNFVPITVPNPDNPGADDCTIYGTNF